MSRGSRSWSRRKIATPGGTRSTSGTHAARDTVCAARGGATPRAADPRARRRGTLAGRRRRARAGDRGDGGHRARARRRRRADVPDRWARVLVPAPGRRPHRLPRRTRQSARRPAAVRGARVAARRRVQRHARAARRRGRLTRRGTGSWPRSRSPGSVRTRPTVCAPSPASPGAPRAHRAVAARRAHRARPRRHALRPRGARAPGGERRLANVRKLLRLAREFEAQEDATCAGSSTSSRRWRGKSSGPTEKGEAPVESEDLEAVRIMTIHRAKGLEFPVVCVADMGREPFTGGRDLLRLDRDGRIGLKLPSTETAAARRSTGSGSRTTSRPRPTPRSGACSTSR